MSAASRSIASRIIKYFSEQAAKMIDRPLRLLALPLILLIRALLSVPRLAPLISVIPDRCMRAAYGDTFRIAVANYLFLSDRPAEALCYLRRALRAARPSADEFLVWGLCLSHGFGHVREAVSLWNSANNLGLAEAQALGLADCRLRVLDGAWARHIGDTAELDYVIKLGILEGRSRNDTTLYLPHGSPVANRFLLRQLEQHFRLVEAPADLPFDPGAVQALHYDLLGPCLPDRTTAFFWQIAGNTYERWHRTGKGPLLTLAPDVEARGRALLHGAGIPEKAWFVALHVRESRWDARHAGLHGIRNADISTYLPAIAEITRRGGWVIRLGDPSMTPLPPLPNVIDYAHSAMRADWMDIFILARCQFMIGTTSGPNFVPPIYGRPCVLTNWWPPAGRPWHASDIFVPKMPRKLSDGRYLTLSEMLREPFGWCHSRRRLADPGGVRVVDSDPRIICGAVEEMLARQDGDPGEDTTTVELRQRADVIYRAQGVAGMGELARAFLHRHADLIT
jgi:putative glycosyltransferase (TIGR04372 family)